MTAVALLTELQVAPQLMRAQVAGGACTLAVSANFAKDFVSRLKGLPGVTIEVARDMQVACNAAPFEPFDLESLSNAIETTRSMHSTSTALALTVHRRCNQYCDTVEL